MRMYNTIRRYMFYYFIVHARKEEIRLEMMKLLPSLLMPLATMTETDLREIWRMKLREKLVGRLPHQWLAFSKL